MRVATTKWSQVLTARDGSQTEARTALEGLCQAYWLPIYAFIRHQGSDPDEALDLTQAYFTELLEKDFLADVDPSKGRFRAFLLASLRHFLSHQRGRERALKRGGGTLPISLDRVAREQTYEAQPADEMNPEAVFEHRWAMTIFERALGRLEGESVSSGTGERFDRLKQYLTSAEEQVPYRQVASDLEMSEKAVNSAVQRLRKRLGRVLREEIAQTVADPAAVDDELRHLLSVIRP